MRTVSRDFGIPKSTLSDHYHMISKSNHLSVESNHMPNRIEPHTTHPLQPLDAGVFKPAKTSWNTIVNKFNHNYIYKPLDKFSFPALVKELISTLKPQYAFKKSGLLPLCLEAMITDKIKFSSLFTPSRSNTPSSQSNTSSLLSPFSSLLNNRTINQHIELLNNEYVVDMKGYADRIIYCTKCS